MALNIVFMGTPLFARYMLDQLLSSEHNILAVVTAVDKPAGRGQNLKQSEVKERALQAGIPILQPMSLKDEAFIHELKAFNADLFIVVAFRMLPEVVWKIPQKGTINLHASLLPDFRGAAPINWAIILGEETTGLTTFYINEAIDCGAIISQKSLNILPEWNAGDLHDAMLPLGAELLLETVHAIQNSTVLAQPQILKIQPKEAPKLNRNNTRISFDRLGKEIENLVRGLSPYPSAYTYLLHKPTQQKVQFKILQGFFVPGTPSSSDLKADKTGIFFPCSDGYFCVQQLQAEGKRKMRHDEFMAGNDVSNYQILSE